MKTTKLLPTLFVAATTLVSGVSIANAQRMPAIESPMASEDMIKVHSREHRGDRDEYGRGRQGDSGMMRQFFAQVDADGNGSVTQEEVDAFRTAQVRSADSNGDGALNIQEFDTIYRAFTRSRMVDAFQNLDEDGDGVISSEEMDARYGAAVKRMDRNGDGVLTIEERGRKHDDRRG
tara:strand:+ start:70 stop:600 length:531 start_codon:yes stop_codon:yes gene_type:complete